MFDTISDRLGTGFILGSAPSKCNCDDQFSPSQTKDCFPPDSDSGNGDFMSSIGAILILLALFGFSQNHIDSVDGLRKRVDNFHQELLDVIDETERKAKELQKEDMSDAL